MTAPAGALRTELDPDATRFLSTYASAFAFPAAGARHAERIADYLRSERARLSDIPGTGALSEAARRVHAHDAETADGVPVRVYLPEGATAPLPALLYFHGGGFVSGSVNLNDSGCRILASAGGFAVISVEYRLAPEHPHPAPLDDADSALSWVRAEAVRGALPFAPDRIGVAGSSAGAALAAALAIRDAGRGGPRLALQVLIYPVLDARMSTDSYRENGTGYFVSAAQMQWYWDCYGAGVARAEDPEFSPAAVRDVSALPPAIIVTAGFDPLRDEGIEFGRRLAAAGVLSVHHHYPDQIHGFVALLDGIGAARPALERVAAEARDHFRLRWAPV